MSLPLRITPDAEEDLLDAKTWYEKKQKGLGNRFVLCVEAAINHIRRVPLAGLEVYPGVRRVVVKHFPYGVFYCLGPDFISIISVYHSHRDSPDWQSRIHNRPKS